MTSEIKYLLPSSTSWDSIALNSDDDKSSAISVEQPLKILDSDPSALEKDSQKINSPRLDSKAFQTSTGTADKNILMQQLLSAMQMQNIVVLAGSGTSMGGSVGGPSMQDLWNKCTANDADKIMRKIGYSVAETEKNIEVALSLCEAYLQVNKEDQEVIKFIEACKEIIIDKCSFEKNENALNAHRTFIHRLSRRRSRDSRLKLFTTNYDTCFEAAANSQGIVIIDGFSFAKPRHYDPRFFDFDIVRRTPNSQVKENYLEGVFQLFKLHGSVTWERENDYIIEKDASPSGACMIFPAKGKYQQSYIQPHLELMARYLAALREANTCLIIIGFGFNDDHLSEPIISAIRTNPHLKVIVVDKSAEDACANKLEKKYWKALNKLHNKGEDISFINSSFEDFANLIPDLRAVTPAERMAQAVKSIVGSME